MQLLESEIFFIMLNGRLRRPILGGRLNARSGPGSVAARVAQANPFSVKHASSSPVMIDMQACRGSMTVSTFGARSGFLTAFVSCAFAAFYWVEAARRTSMTSVDKQFNVLEGASL